MHGHYKPWAVAWNFWGTRLGSAGNMILSRWPIVQVNEDRQMSTRSYTALDPISWTSSERNYEERRVMVVTLQVISLSKERVR
jgi:hypothetical protein